jgi:hypothetical protein
MFRSFLSVAAVIFADLVLALAYNYLAGGKAIAYAFTVIWLPITAFIFGICFVGTRLDLGALLSVKAIKIRFLKSNWQHRLWDLSFLAYACLPIILNGLSQLTGNQFLFSVRYASLLFFGLIYVGYQLVLEKRFTAQA